MATASSGDDDGTPIGPSSTAGSSSSSSSPWVPEGALVDLWRGRDGVIHRETTQIQNIAFMSLMVPSTASEKDPT